jgi:peptidoglycan/LPS O-acetylase OafA/YrhL
MAGRLAHIDALRGLAMLWILAYHLYDSKSQAWLLPNQLGMLVQQGYFGVQLFLIISGFSIFYSLKYTHSGGDHRYRNFFIRRFFRIAPLFYFAIALYLLVDGWGPRAFAPQGLSWLNVASAILLVGSWWPTSTNSVPPVGGRFRWNGCFTCWCL